MRPLLFIFLEDHCFLARGTGVLPVALSLKNRFICRHTLTRLSPSMEGKNHCLSRVQLWYVYPPIRKETFGVAEDIPYAIPYFDPGDI